MLGTAGLQFARGGTGDDRFYKPRCSRLPNNHRNIDDPKQLRRAQSDVTNGHHPENGTTGFQDLSNPAPITVPGPQPGPAWNLDRFLESITPAVPAQYLSKTTMRGLSTCDVEFRPYFVLGDLWESFKEWSAYGAGVPLVLNDSDCVVQYYVPYLSGIQIYCSGESLKSRSDKCSRLGEDSDSDFRDSSSDGSSDSEPDKMMKCSRELWNHSHIANNLPLRMDRLSLRDHQSQSDHREGFSSDEGESMNSQGGLLFEYLERDPPYSREPLADKISDLALRFPELKTLRSCDLLPSSWISVAWYPIYRIPTGPTLKDLDACFLTYHFLHTPLEGAQNRQGPVVTYPSEMDGVPEMLLPVFGLASYKFKGSLWTRNGGNDRLLVNSLLQAADNWLRKLEVNHPDFLFFCRR